MKTLPRLFSIVSLLVGGVVVANNGYAALLGNFTAAGNTPATIQSTVDSFRGATGALNPNTPVNFADGRREINWDGVPDIRSDPNPFPGDFFNGNVAGRARGIEFNPVGTTTGFELSATALSGEPILYGFPGEFQVFSPERLFRTVGGNQFDILFFSPANQVSGALTDSFGLVYTDADSGALPVLEFFDVNGGLLHTVTGLATANSGLGFVGSVFDHSEVARVLVTLGGPGDPLSSGVGIVMDDFIYGEPQRIPEPGTLALMLGAGAGFFMRRRIWGSEHIRKS